MHSRFFIISLILVVGSGLWVAQYVGVDDTSSANDLWVVQTSSTDILTRYDLTEFLSLWNCEQCVFANPEDLEKYDAQRWADFSAQAGNNFDDVEAGDEYYDGKEYSVCIARAAEKGWINGFPRSTSPFCPGRFCGANTLVYGELAQAIYNIIAPSIAQTYQINRSDVQARSQTVSQDIDLYTQQIIAEWVQSCGEDSCTVWSVQQLDVYTRYCRRNLWACDMLTTDVLAEWQYPLAITNLLVSQWVLTRPDVMQLGRYDAVSRGLFDLALGSLVSTNSCTRNIDYDLDGIKNDVDNCPVVYNPDQKNRDGDELWDVCDDDIDGDTAPNPIGVIDDQDNIDHNKYKEQPDTDLPDDLQPGSDTPKILTATATPPRGTTTTDILLEMQAEWDVADIQWYLGDGNLGNTATLTHRYTTPGLQHASVVVTRTDQTKSLVKLPIEIVNSQDLAVALEASADPLVGTGPLLLDLTHRYTWEVDAVKRYIVDDEIVISPGEPVQYTLTNPGLYELLAEAYYEDVLVGVSRVTVTVIDTAADQDTGRWAILVADPLVVTEWEIVDFDTRVDGFDPDQVSEVVRDYGDETSETTNSLATSKRYTQTGPFVVWQTIRFGDGYPDLIQEATIYVRPAQQDNSRSSQLVLDRYSWPISSSFLASLEIDFAPTQITKVTRSRWDSKKKVKTQADGDELIRSNHIFKKPGLYSVQAQILTTDGAQRLHEATVQVTGEQACISNEGVCDMDEDGIIDQCDTDIDGDGVPNMLWLLVWEADDCRIVGDIVDADRLLEQVGLIREWAQLDNCSFEPNADQADQDADGFGDVCDSVVDPQDPDQWDIGWGSNPWSPGDDGDNDRDNDGIPDDRDACPDIPENSNGTQDDDGCPELPNSGNIPSRSTIRVSGCVQCPCPKADYNAQVLPGDRIKAILTDPTGEIVYSHAAPKVVK